MPQDAQNGQKSYTCHPNNEEFGTVYGTIKSRKQYKKKVNFVNCENHGCIDVSLHEQANKEMAQSKWANITCIDKAM